MRSTRKGIVVRLLGIGWYIAMCISGGAALGFWVDNVYDSSPIFTLFGVILGVTLGMFGMIIMLKLVLADEPE